MNTNKEFLLVYCLALASCASFSSSLPAADDPLISLSSATEQSKVRSGRQVFPGGDSCTFGSAERVELCGWSRSNLSSLQWELSTGNNHNWIGGPPTDSSEEVEGGYVVFETSQIPNISGRSSQSAVLEGPIHPSTSALGACLTFNYAVAGLSPEKVRVLLHPIPNAVFALEGLALNRETDHGADVVLWETRDSTDGQWRTAEVVYTCRHPHQIYLEGIPHDAGQLTRRYRGFIAIDNVNLKSAEGCPGHCNFDGGFCDWTNEQTDDFDWSLGRGSQNPSTGPIMDRASYTHGGSSGGYAYIDSSFPRKTADKARLSSREFSRTGSGPLCMRFWTHMFGNGVGMLRVLIHDKEANEDRVVWSLAGEAGNAWYQGQVPISSSTSFKIVFEGEVGKNNLGDIAIDDISFAPGACPSAPQTAAGTSGDCTFEIDECGWTNVGSASRTDEMDWERRLGQNAKTPISDHTLGSPAGNFMTLGGIGVQRAGDRAWLVSQALKGSTRPRCLSFWYYMHEPFIDTSGPSLGGLKIYTRPAANNDLNPGQQKLTGVWRLYNQQAPVWKYAQAMIMESEQFQVIFEGVHGSSRANGFMAVDDIAFFEGDCETMPTSGYVSEGECSFEKDMCNWKNMSSDAVYRWQLATITRRPANLPDKTFGAPVGYAYFDIFSQNTVGSPVKLISPTVTSSAEKVCFSFWYSAFGAGDSTQLRVLVQEVRTSSDPDSSGDESEATQQIWRLTAVDLDTVRPEWRAAQVAFNGGTAKRIILEGKANNGGFAVDDASFHPGECPTRPPEASNRRK
ncbi:unnamed protein product [Allacma fusca]|uniref:MAM domain-containing protein n=1 Tax=Allacma fusca TaxID=39272 RepID=A0A8J2LCN5_9HEXA|nr:unnamed protein product [Allacma fusca]